MNRFEPTPGAVGPFRVVYAVAVLLTAWALSVPGLARRPREDRAAPAATLRQIAAVTAGLRTAQH